MDWYYEYGNNDFLVPNDQEDLSDRHLSPDSWSNWEMSASEGFNSPQQYLIMDRNATEVEFNFIGESFSNEIEFDPSPFDKDQSSSSSVCGGIGNPDQSFQQATLSCDHQPKYQLQDLPSFEHMDDIFVDSVLEDFPCVENLHKTFFYPENQCSNTHGGLQTDIAASEFVPCNSNSKNCEDIEMDEFLAPFEELGDEQLSLEESTLHNLEVIIAQFTEKTRICFRDALYRLARNTKQQHLVEDMDAGLYMQQAMPGAVHNETLRSEDKKPMESETNSVDRAVANLMFNKMEINILNLPLTTLVNMKQEVIGSKALQGKSSKALNVAQKSHYPQPKKLPGDAEVPRFGSRNQNTDTEPQIAYADPTKKSFMLEFG